MAVNLWGPLEQLKNDNPTSFSILLGAIAVAAAVAIIATFGIKLQAELPNIAYVIIIGLVLFVLSRVFSDPVIWTAARWFAAVILVLWVGAFIWAKVEPASRTANCLAEFWVSCATVADGLAIAENKAPPLDPGTLPEPPATLKPQDYQVFFQFAGTLKRDDVRAVMTGLNDAGWNVQGVQGGGQRTATAAGYAEVRYGDPTDADAAKELAKAVEASKLISKPIKATATPGITPKTLEIYVSN